MVRWLREKIKKFLFNKGYNVSVIDKILEKEIGEIFDKCKNYTATSKERIYALYKAVEYVIKAKIPGDFVECGVWRGGSTMVIAYTLLKLGEKERKIYLYDTFEGMPQPTNEDKEILSGLSAKDQLTKKPKEISCFSSLQEVKKNMSLTGYPEKNLVFVKGKVENTIPKIMPSQIALLRLDTDWYESTKHELVHLYPELSKNGVLIIDDYGHWAGSKKAVDEYFKNSPILLNRIDYSGRIGLKTK